MECLNTTPEVIDHFLIKQCLEEQGFKGEAGRLIRLEGIPWDKVTEIRFEFKIILRIDHLWVLPALTKLSLSNNYIETIENLESLVNLTELNLSFNKIVRIENLDTLVNLEVLLLYENIITSIENVENLKNLTIFNIGMNCITDQEQVLNLRRHKKLQSFNMKGNPCAENEDFRIYVAAFLPQLQFYVYKFIEEDERALGLEKHIVSLLHIDKIEATERAAQAKLEAEQEEAELQAGSFVEFFNTNHLLLQMFEQDTEGRAFLLIGDDAMECYDEFRDRLLEITMHIFETGQQQYSLRKKEVESYLKCVNEAKTANQKKSIVEMENFTKHKNEILEKIAQMQEDLMNRDITMEKYLSITYDWHIDFKQNNIPKIWKKLMGLEITLYEQLEVVNEVFEHTLTDMVTHFIETAQGGFSEIRTLAGIYLENITDLVQKYMKKALTDSFIIDKEILPYIIDKDTLSNALGASHDVHMQIIDIREDRLMNRAKAWLYNLVNNLENDEINRNRAKILEINHFLDINNEQFMKAIEIECLKQNTDEIYFENI